MAETEKKNDIELLTSFRNHKAIGKKDNKFYIVSNISGVEPQKIEARSEDNLAATEFERGVAVLTYEYDAQYDKRWDSIWEKQGMMVTPSGYRIRLDSGMSDFDIKSQKVQDMIEYARSIYDNPAELLKIDKKVELPSAEVIKAYVDIAKAGLEASLAKAGETYERDRHGALLSHSQEDRQRAAKAGPNYEKTLDLISKLSKKIAVKFQKLKDQHEKSVASSLRGKEAAAKGNIEAIFDEPQRGAE